MWESGNTVESIVLLSKLHAKQNIEVELAMSEMDLTAAESKATYEEIKEYIFERHNVKVSSLYIAQIKQKYGIIERDCYNKPRDKESKPPQCPLEKETLIEEVLRHFKMI
ncbi:MAG: 23S rRNA methyltransferase [Lachnospiraceae bacterium]|nr:23S rRNA methyltransferase [Lachnospiraceae bacterium]